MGKTGVKFFASFLLRMFVGSSFSVSPASAAKQSCYFLLLLWLHLRYFYLFDFKMVFLLKFWSLIEINTSRFQEGFWYKSSQSRRQRTARASIKYCREKNIASILRLFQKLVGCISLRNILLMRSRLIPKVKSGMIVSLLVNLEVRKLSRRCSEIPS